MSFETAGLFLFFFFLEVRKDEPTVDKSMAVHIRICAPLRRPFFSRFQRVYEVHKTQNLNFSLPNPTTPTTVAVEGTEHTIAT